MEGQEDGSPGKKVLRKLSKTRRHSFFLWSWDMGGRCWRHRLEGHAAGRLGLETPALEQSVQTLSGGPKRSRLGASPKLLISEDRPPLLGRGPGPSFLVGWPSVAGRYLLDFNGTTCADQPRTAFLLRTASRTRILWLRRQKKSTNFKRAKLFPLSCSSGELIGALPQPLTSSSRPTSPSSRNSSGRSRPASAARKTTGTKIRG